jgi:Beta-fructosidases (levanase/invertase)
MIQKIKYVFLIAFLASCSASKKQATTLAYNEPHRPQIHFSPAAHWMNDPNGMVYFKNQYHLFYQYYPDSTVWGPMHWAHATSKDLVHWQPQPIALYPDTLGYIFSGSAVVDINNTSGFGKDGKTPLVAIFTHHDPIGAKARTNNYQNQSIAYSLDEGKTWTKYGANPVIKNPGIKDFRDPKVSWFEEGKKWVMILATKDRVTFFSSKNLRVWKKESEFGETVGAHGGVWECPDLFSINYNGEKIWILTISINPGGPNKGSATQYFTGKFDGTTFIPFQTDTRWVDYGPDNYAGVTWSNTGERKISIGWMSNWQYAKVVPTDKWRSAMTVPRDLGLEKIGEKYFIISHPVQELSALNEKGIELTNISASDNEITKKIGKLTGPARLTITSDKIASFAITLSNNAGEKVIIGYDKAADNYFIDRINSGKVSFEKGFAGRHSAPRFSNNQNVDLTLIIDNASVELFADNGLSVMTEIFFPNSPFTNLTVQSADNFQIKSLQYNKMKSIWK